ncbi:hypothetical protein M407DRAFT_228108 [Tulasnella calospora MUT 4182]|uniref:HTH La-type RNA-binding domain-containing protein n=1 Tax=Tulasnella calospora MUT 4182 TaxID=1051891 RepID=A0A0C3L696_9AGAM|nr:hypothetical protein M407DRAFT_228108 [Tulasnella calospora MUT 4182]
MPFSDSPGPNSMVNGYGPFDSTSRGSPNFVNNRASPVDGQQQVGYSEGGVANGYTGHRGFSNGRRPGRGGPRGGYANRGGYGPRQPMANANNHGGYYNSGPPVPQQPLPPQPEYTGYSYGGYYPPAPPPMDYNPYGYADPYAPPPPPPQSSVPPPTPGGAQPEGSPYMMMPPYGYPVYQPPPPGMVNSMMGYYYPPPGPQAFYPPAQPIPAGYSLDEPRASILRQVEFYLSYQNMTQDAYLRGRMDPQGWMDVELIASFNRLRRLTSDLNLVREVMSMSGLIEVSPDGQKCRMANNGWQMFVAPPQMDGIPPAENQAFQSQFVPDAAGVQQQCERNPFAKRATSNGDLTISASSLTKPDTKIYFPVHKAMLRLHSSTFSDMLDIPPGDRGSEANSEIVHLHDDCSALAGLLMVINYPEEVFTEPLSRDTFNSATAVLPMADKYDMPKVMKMFLPRVKADWPKTLARWDLNENHIQATMGYVNRLRTTKADNRYGDDVIVEPCSAIRFGRTFPLRAILPAAFYHLSRLPPIFEKKSDLYLEHVIQDGRTADWQLLQVDDYQTLIRGKSEIREWVKSIANYAGESQWKCISHPPREDCDGHPWWTQKMKWRLLEKLADDEADVLRLFSRLTGQISKERWSGSADFKLCGYCFVELSKLLEDYRQEFWRALTEFFGLGGEAWLEEEDSVSL